MEEIAGKFSLGGRVAKVEEFGSGLINLTYVVELESGKRFVLQRLNTVVFTRPEEVMRNVGVVCEHLRGRPNAEGERLQIVPTLSGEGFLREKGGGFWRCFHFVEGAVTHDVVGSLKQAREAGRGFGRFQCQLASLRAESLTDTLPGLHDTRGHFEKLEDVVAEVGGDGVEEEMELIRGQERWLGRLGELEARGYLPRRIVHNDTKISNLMVDEDSGEARVVIDLDTVGPGLAHSDFGDLVRTVTSPTTEDDPELRAVHFRIDYFRAVLEGYWTEMGGILTAAEVANLSLADKTITLELAMRFLADHLRGDRYFKTERRGQNLERARNQLRLFQSMLDQELDELEVIKEVTGREAVRIFD